MSKKSRQLIIGLVCLVLVGVVVAVMSLIPVLQGMTSNEGTTSSTASSSTSSNTIERLIDCSVTDVKGFTVDNKYGNFEFTAIEKEDTISWEVAGYEGLSLMTNTVDTLADLTYDMRIFKTIGTVSNLAEYGLANPQTTMSIQYKDGSEKVVKFGNITTTSETRCYVQMEGEETVYVITSCYAVVNLRKETLISPIIYDLDYMDTTYEEYVAPVFDMISITGRGHDSELRIVPKPANEPQDSPAYYYEYYFEKPFKVTAHVNFSKGFLLTVSTMTADRIEAVKPDEATLTKYGFDNPIKVQFKASGLIHHFEVGNIEDGIAYVMADGNDVIYAVPEDQVILATGGMNALRDSLAYLVDIDSVEFFTIDFADGETYVVENHRTVKKEETSSSATSSTTSSSTEEEKITYEYTQVCEDEVLEHFNTFYGIILENYREGDVTEDIEKGKLIMTITFDHFDELATEKTVFEIYECKNDSRRVILNINGRDDSLIKASWADRIADAWEKVLDGRKPITY